MSEDRRIEVDGDDLDRVAPQIPHAETVPEGTRVLVFAGKSRPWLGKLLPPRGAPPPGIIGSALLARGYENVGSGEDGGRAVTWGERRRAR
jgi:hypothetical protein